MESAFLELGIGTSNPTTPDPGLVKVYGEGTTIKAKFDSGTVVDLGPQSPPAASVVTNTPAGNISATTVQAAINELDAEKAPITHVGAIGVSEHGVATGVAAGFLSPSDFTKLGGIAVGATANDTDANLRARASHTGTQSASTIVDFSSAADARAAIGDAAHVAAGDPHPQYAVDGDVTAAQAYAVQRANHIGTQLAATISDMTTAARTAAVQDSIADSVTTIAPSQNAVFDALALKESIANKGVANGYAGIDGSGKIPLSLIPQSIQDELHFISTWNANTNSPTLTSGAGSKGGFYIVSVDGTTNLDGENSWKAKDWAVFDGTVWRKVDNTDSVDSVNSQTGAVVLTTTNISEGTNQYFTNSRAKTAVVDDAIVDAVTDKAPSQNAVFDALALKETVANVALKVAKAGDTMTGQLSVPSVNLTGTAGAGFTNYPAQTAVPATPATGFVQYAGSTGRFVWKGTNGFPIAFDGLSNTALRIYTLPNQDGTFMVDPMTTDGDIIIRSSSLAARLAIGTAGRVLKVVSGLPAWAVNETSLFGDANLANLTLTGALTLTAPGYYNTLAINGAGSLNTAGYPIFCKVLDLSGAAANAINFNGGNGNASSSSAGGTAAGALATTFLGGAGNGTAGGAGSTNAGVQAGAPTAQSPSNGGSGGTGRAGGTSVSAGGALRTGAACSNPTRYAVPILGFVRGASVITGGGGGAGGGGGGGTGALTGFGGGAGGSGGGMIAIFAEKIITDGTTAAGAISANGGNGGASGAATNLNTASGGGGGAGGGGYILIIYAEKSGSAVTSLVRANGGTGGNSGNGNGTGGAGNAGDGGDAGYLGVVNIASVSGSHVNTSSGSTGGNAVGSVGATGGAGATSTVSI